MPKEILIKSPDGTIYSINYTLRDCPFETISIGVEHQSQPEINWEDWSDDDFISFLKRVAGVETDVELGEQMSPQRRIVEAWRNKGLPRNIKKTIILLANNQSRISSEIKKIEMEMTERKGDHGNFYEND